MGEDKRRNGKEQLLVVDLKYFSLLSSSIHFRKQIVVFGHPAILPHRLESTIDTYS